MTATPQRRIRLAYVVSHPIQYQAPLLRRIAQEPDVDLTVFFCSNRSVIGYADKGFGGVHIKWDTPLLHGYRYEFLPIIYRSSGLGFWRSVNRGFYCALRDGKFDARWLKGYWNAN